MKKIIIFILVFIVLTTGCTQNTEKQQFESPAFQTKIIENNNSYDIREYKKIKDLSLDFEKSLYNYHVSVNSLCFNEEQYVDGLKKTAVFTIDNNNGVTLKFDDNENLILLSYKYDQEKEEDNKIWLSIIHWDYFNFSSDEINKISAISDNTISIRNFEIENNITLGQFFITIKN